MPCVPRLGVRGAGITFGIFAPAGHGSYGCSSEAGSYALSAGHSLLAISWGACAFVSRIRIGLAVAASRAGNTLP